MSNIYKKSYFGWNTFRKMSIYENTNDQFEQVVFDTEFFPV